MSDHYSSQQIYIGRFIVVVDGCQRTASLAPVLVVSASSATYARGNANGGFTFLGSIYGGFILMRHFASPIRLRRETFQDVAVYVPEQSEAFLSWHYGDWRRPDPGYHRYTAGPIRSEEQRRLMRAYAPWAVRNCIKTEGSRKSLLMAQSAGDLFPDDALWPGLVEALKVALVGQSRGDDPSS